jgi:hypothetical protein
MTKKTSNIKHPEVADIPIIGGREGTTTADGGQQQAQALVQGVMKYLEPIMENILNKIDELERRVAQVETIVDGALVEILTERIKDKLQPKSKHIEDAKIVAGRKE